MENYKPTIIYGAGIVGKTIYDICKSKNISITAFCDGNFKTAQSKFCNLPVFHTSELKLKYPDAHFIISVAAIKDVVDKLHSLNFKDWETALPYIQNLNTIDYTKYAIETCITSHKAFLNPDKTFIRSIDIIITERCTLRCKDCSNLMQYFKHPKNLDTNSIINSIDTLSNSVDSINELRIIGGEAFINKDWHIIAKHSISKSNIHRTLIYTNATILPNEIHISQIDPTKFLVVITDYPSLSKKLSQLHNLLDKHNIAHHTIKATEWLDCSIISHHNRPPIILQSIYDDCCAKNLLTLSDSKLFRCPYAANANRLSAVPDIPSDYVDISTEPENIKPYTLRNFPLSICQYCHSRPLFGPPIPPAIQIKKPIGYKTC